MKLQDFCKLSIFTLCPISQASEAPPLDIASEALPGNLLSGDSERRIEGVAAAWNATNLADLNTIAIEHHPTRLPQSLSQLKTCQNGNTSPILYI
ncbi:hypothetical protein QUB75_01940 [Microcoleus sp. K1-B6]|uniref:hypothetical protein n=1 Tax=Microcoleus sp. K1-B1 TaxID=2818782 RepID=UPI002FD47F7A